MRLDPEKIAAAAICEDGWNIYVGRIHAIIREENDLTGGEEGFVTTHNRFVDRCEAQQIAQEAGQIPPEFYENSALVAEDMLPET